jgi:hypothetical protein
MTQQELEKMSKECVEEYSVTLERQKLITGTILEQLGGVQFLTMTGAKNLSSLVEHEDILGGLSFTIGPCGGFNSTGINKVFIFLNANDTYTMAFNKVRKGFVRNGKYYQGKTTEVRKIEQVYCDQLKDLFEETTGLLVSLFGRR